MKVRSSLEMLEEPKGKLAKVMASRKSKTIIVGSLVAPAAGTMAHWLSNAENRQVLKGNAVALKLRLDDARESAIGSFGSRAVGMTFETLGVLKVLWTYAVEAVTPAKPATDVNDVTPATERIAQQY